MRVYPVNAVAGGCKKLRRLPHVFSKMIELPFGADADVYIEEDITMFRFFAVADGVSGGVRAQAVVVHPGVMKVVVVDGAGAGLGEFREDELEFDRWRFRLPPSTLPRLATAEYVDGELIVTVPKRDGQEELEEYFEEGNGGFNGSAAGKGAMLARAAGTYAKIIKEPASQCLVRLPSGVEKLIDSLRRATIGEGS